jgi:hypothetical protein
VLLFVSRLLPLSACILQISAPSRLAPSVFRPRQISYPEISRHPSSLTPFASQFLSLLTNFIAYQPSTYLPLLPRTSHFSLLHY